MRKKILLFVALLLFVFTGIHAENIKNDDVNDNSWIGIINSAGVLKPIFQIDASGIWSKCWPEPVNGPSYDDEDKPVIIKKSIGEIPVDWLGKFRTFPEKWRLVDQAKGKELLSVLYAYKFQDRCTQEWAIKSDLVPAARNEKKAWYSSIVVAGNLKIELPVVITYTSKEHPRLATFLRKTFDGVEDKYVKDYLEGYEQGPYADNEKKKEDLTCIPLGVPISKDLRKKNNIMVSEITKLGNMYYFECERQYPVAPGETYTGKAFFTGWAYKNKSGEPVIWKKIFMCSDGVIDGPYYFNIYGGCTFDNRKYVIVSRYYYESSDFAVLEVLEDGLKEIIVIEGSGC